jgi:hypothetical protein
VYVVPTIHNHKQISKHVFLNKKRYDSHVFNIQGLTTKKKGRNTRHQLHPWVNKHLHNSKDGPLANIAQLILTIL